MATQKTQQTPYAGCVRVPGTNKLTPVKTAPHVMGIGPTGKGKTARWLGIGSIQWRGPRVLVSSKTDFMKLTIEHGLDKRGPIYVLDLAGEIDDSSDWLQDVKYTRVVSDPTALINNDDEAMAMSSLIMQMGSIGAGGGSGGGNDSFWQTLSAQPLAALLLAGKASGEGIDWTVRATGRTMGDSPDDPTPSWIAGIGLLQGDHASYHSEELGNAAGMEDKLRDSMIATAKAGLAPWLLSTVRGGDGSVPFHPKMLEGPGEPTLYITSPADGAAAGAAVAVIEMIIRHWRKGIERGLRRILLAIDEFANVAAIPNIDRYLSEARGLGVACMLALQSSTQLYHRFGESQGKAILDVCPAILLLNGSDEFGLLETASKWSGEHDVWRKSIDHQQHESLTAERAPVRSVSDLLPRSEKVGRLLLDKQEGYEVELPGIWEIAS